MKKRTVRNTDTPDLFLKLTFLQIIICALIAGGIIAAAKTNPEAFEKIREDFTFLLSEDFDYRKYLSFDGKNDSVTDSGDTSCAEAESCTDDEEEENTADTASQDLSDGASLENAGGEDMDNDDIPGKTNLGCYALEDVAAVPVMGSVTSDFGYRTHPIYGTYGFHSGIDIAADEGTKIHAALDGEVTAAGTSEKSGNYVIIAHDDGIETLYAHCSALLVKEGDTVRKGDTIALVGSTGLATGPHLHFEVHKDDVKCDPNFLLKDALNVY